MRITEHRLRSIIRSVIIESSESSFWDLKSEEEVIDAFESVLDRNSRLERQLKRAIIKQQDPKYPASMKSIKSIPKIFAKNLRDAYRNTYTIKLDDKELQSAINAGLEKYTANIKNEYKNYYKKK